MRVWMGSENASDAPVGTLCFVCAYKDWNEDSKVVCTNRPDGENGGSYGGLGARVHCPGFKPISKDEAEGGKE